MPVIKGWVRKEHGPNGTYWENQYRWRYPARKHEYYNGLAVEKYVQECGKFTKWHVYVALFEEKTKNPIKMRILRRGATKKEAMNFAIQWMETHPKGRSSRGWDEQKVHVAGL